MKAQINNPYDLFLVCNLMQICPLLDMLKCHVLSKTHWNKGFDIRQKTPTIWGYQQSSREMRATKIRYFYRIAVWCVKRACSFQETFLWAQTIFEFGKFGLEKIPSFVWAKIMSHCKKESLDVYLLVYAIRWGSLKSNSNQALIIHKYIFLVPPVKSNHRSPGTLSNGKTLQ